MLCRHGDRVDAAPVFLGDISLFFFLASRVKMVSKCRFRAVSDRRVFWKLRGDAVKMRVPMSPLKICTFISGKVLCISHSLNTKSNTTHLEISIYTVSR